MLPPLQLHYARRNLRNPNWVSGHLADGLFRLQTITHESAAEVSTGWRFATRPGPILLFYSRLYKLLNFSTKSSQQHSGGNRRAEYLVNCGQRLTGFWRELYVFFLSCSDHSVTIQCCLICHLGLFTIFAYLRPVCWKLKGGFFETRFYGSGKVWDRKRSHSLTQSRARIVFIDIYEYSFTAQTCKFLVMFGSRFRDNGSTDFENVYCFVNNGSRASFTER